MYYILNENDINNNNNNDDDNKVEKNRCFINRLVVITKIL